VFVRPRDLQPIRDDLTLLIVSTMRIDAKLEEVKQMLLEEEDGDDDERPHA
jgi:hypothetical protein